MRKIMETIKMVLRVFMFVVSGVLPLTCNPFTVDVIWGQKKKPYLILDHWILIFCSGFFFLGIAQKEQCVTMKKIVVAFIVAMGIYTYLRHIDLALGLCEGIRLKQLCVLAAAYIESFIIYRNVYSRNEYDKLCDLVVMEEDRTMRRSLKEAIIIYHMELFHVTDIHDSLL